MYVIHTFFDKCNTISFGQNENLSLNPIMELCYGGLITRGLIHFDTSRLSALYSQKNYSDISKLKHHLKMTNASSITDRNINKCFPGPDYDGVRERAISFDLILFLIPQFWDSGRGFDFSKDIFYGKHRGYSEYGSNWFNSTTVEEWKNPGIYTIDQFYKALYGENESYSDSDSELPIIIGRQHFDYGNENLDIDITDAVNAFITGELENYGIGIAFVPDLEDSCPKMTQYVGFFTPHTNSFFEPYIETIYDDHISDSRLNFYLDKPNRLYFYANVGGRPVNLDELPTCSIDCNEYEVKQAEIGAYYIELEMDGEETESNTMFYDVWDNIKYNGKTLPPVEMYFTTKSPEGYYQFGVPKTADRPVKAIPNLYGIQDGEKLHRDEIRKVNVEYVIPYTKEQYFPTYDTEYRLYVKMGEKEITVIDWQPVDTEYVRSSFMLDTASLVPNRYYVDVRTKYGREEIIHRNLMTFDIVSDATNMEV